MLTTLIVLMSVTSSGWFSDVDTINNDDEMMTNGVLFNVESKTLLTKKFVNIEFLVPFPYFDLNITKEIDNYLRKLDDLWMHPSVFCNMNFSTTFNSNDSTFNIQWLITQLHKETDLARHDEDKLREETKEFLNSTAFTNAPRRTKRAAPLAALAVASIGLFGGGILVGNQGCGLKGIFGSCQEKAKEKAKNIERMADFVDELRRSPTESKNKWEILHGLKRIYGDTSST